MTGVAGFSVMVGTGNGVELPQGTKWRRAASFRRRAWWGLRVRHGGGERSIVCV